MKTVYIEVFQEVFHFPPIASKRGRWIWYGLGPIYWVLAFLIAAAVPNLNGIVSFIGGLLSLNFTYTFPGAVSLGLLVHHGAELPEENFDPATGVTYYIDSGYKRLVRGFMKKWYFTVPPLFYTLLLSPALGWGRGLPLRA